MDIYDEGYQTLEEARDKIDSARETLVKAMKYNGLGYYGHGVLDGLDEALCLLNALIVRNDGE